MTLCNRLDFEMTFQLKIYNQDSFFRVMVFMLLVSTVFNLNYLTIMSHIYVNNVNVSFNGYVLLLYA